MMFKKSLLVTVFSFFLIGCGGSGGTTSQNEVQSHQFLVNWELLVEMDAQKLKDTLPPQQATFVQFGYKAYKIAYNTTYQGQKIVASGLLVLPLGYEAIENFPLATVCDAHGTEFTNANVPTNAFMPTQNGVGVAFSSMGGFVTLQPDYIGFGDSLETRHPYMLKDPLSDGSIDMIQAFKEFAAQNGIPINTQLFLSGYSEGGYATMATLKEIETNYSDTFKITAVAPMAAPYNIDRMAQGVLSTPTMVYSPFMGFVAFSYARYYDDITIEQLITPTYAPSIPTLFSGSFTGEEIYKQLTSNTQEFFTLTQINDYFDNPQDSFKKAMVENSLHDWKPTTPMRLYHCDEDPVIPFALSQEAYDNFVANGATNVELMTLNGDDHSACAALAYPQVVQWFDAKRRGQ